MNPTTLGKQVLLYLSLVLTLATVFYSLMPVNGLVGHDYAHYYPRIYLGASHFWKNGWKVPHFTASLCGGVPFFADPQSYYYSLPQFLAFFISPWVATYSSYLLFYFVGYWGMMKLMSLFSQRVELKHFIALVFLLNGFSFAHLYVGHANHYQFLLLPMFVYLFLRPQKLFSHIWWQATLINSFIVVYCIYSGALHILAVLVATMFVIFPFLVSRKFKQRELWSSVVMAISIFAIVSAISSGKWMAVSRYSSHFYLHGIDKSGLSPGFLFIQYLWFDPLNLPMSTVFGKWAFGPWEYVGFLSKATLIGLLCYCLGILPKVLRSEWKVSLGVSLTSILLILLASGNELNESLPFFRHYHNPLKLMGGFIIPLCLVLGVVLESFVQSKWLGDQAAWWKATVYVMGVGILLSEFLMNVRPFQKHPWALGYHYDAKAYENFKRSGGIQGVTAVDFSGRDAVSSMNRGGSLLACYEPLFGYRLEGLKANLRPGSVFLESESRFNLTHPGCLLYGRELGCAAWDRIPTSESYEFSEFVHGKIPAKWVPAWQNRLSLVNGFCFLLLVNALILNWAHSIRFSKKLRLVNA